MSATLLQPKSLGICGKLWKFFRDSFHTLSCIPCQCGRERPEDTLSVSLEYLSFYILPLACRFNHHSGMGRYTGVRCSHPQAGDPKTTTLPSSGPLHAFPASSFVSQICAFEKRYQHRARGVRSCPANRGEWTLSNYMRQPTRSLRPNGTTTAG